MIDHGRQRRALAEPVGPVTSTSPRGFKDNSAKTLGVFNCRASGSCLDRPEHRTGAAVLVERVDAKARQALDLERESHSSVSS